MLSTLRSSGPALSARLVGWAILQVVPEDANFALLKDALGPQHYCLNGAIKVIMPIDSGVQSGVVMPGREGQVNLGFNEQQVAWESRQICQSRS